jgi:hypothetical protein
MNARLPVISAIVDNQVFVKEPSLVYFDVVNLGTKTITAFFVRLYCTSPDGVEHFVGSTGQDMIDYLDPMPESEQENKSVRPIGRIEPLSRRRAGRNVTWCEGAPVIRPSRARNGDVR